MDQTDAVRPGAHAVPYCGFSAAQHQHPQPVVSLDLTEYSVFALATTGLCIGVLLTHQANVSDHVLWTGGLVIVTFSRS